MKPKVYLETTIPSLLAAWPNRDVVILGQQQATRDWWDQHRHKYELFISDLVAVECRRGDAIAAREREELLAPCSLLNIPEAAQQLAQRILAAGLMPARATADALHVAIAAVHKMDFLLTWNCRHIANAATVERVRGVCSQAGYQPPVICTPFELMV